MPCLNDLAKDFLSRQHIAVAGVAETRETAASLSYRTLRGHGYEVYAINRTSASSWAIPATPISPPSRRDRTAW